ncbi:energy transducer TonB family protein [Trinickia diaoshuihuensis]|jgi:protein TonB|uniref:energy transducer TonB family protein n=1 Tax=Trinickia diaoshuihuensis TaxID=2292265 RepID=UPI000E246441|nr:energy transducer TonB [Trinickia diaoshuihuensis]
MPLDLVRHSASRTRGLPYLAACAALLAASACTFTPPTRPSAATLPPPAAVNSVTLDQYREAVARRIAERSPSYIEKHAPQAMLRSLVVVAFTIDRNGKLVRSSVYRTNGDDEAEATALATLRRAAPLPEPPAKLLNGVGQVEMMEDWLFNDDGKFQLRELAAPQALTFD